MSNINNFLDENELAALMSELSKIEAKDAYTEEMTPEMEASQKRYEEYIIKHKNDNNN